MGVGAIQLGQRLVWKGIAFRIHRSLDGAIWVLEDLASGRYIEHAEIDLLAAWRRGDLRFAERLGDEKPDSDVEDLLDAHADSFQQSYPKSAWDKAKKKLVFVEQLLSAPVTKELLRPLIQEIWEDAELWTRISRPAKPPAWNTVAMWLRQFRTAGRDIRALIDRTHDQGNRDARYPEDVLEIADDLIETRYMTTERPTLADVLEDLQGRLERENLSLPKAKRYRIPGKSFLAGRIKLWSAFDRYAARFGLSAARVKFRNAKQGAPALKPLARAAMDHYRMNLFVVDEVTGLPLGRPWLTLILDECTRYVLGFYIGFEEPSNVSAARAIRHAIAPKDEDAASVEGLVNSWLAWGVFDYLIVDNGLEFHGDTVENGCLQFGLKIQYCPRKRPWYKGKVERFFRTVDLCLTSWIPGKTFENLFKREDYDPAANAVVSLTTLRSVLIKWIVDYYHQKEHRVIGMSPAQAWDETIGLADQYLPASSIILDSAFSKEETRSLGIKGIEHDSLFYQSEDLRRVRKRFGNDFDVIIRVMDDDLSWIVVQVPDSKTLLRVPAVDEAYTTNLTRWQHTVCKRFRRRRFEREGVKMSLLAAKECIRAMIRGDALHTKRASRGRQKRFMGDDSLGTPASAAAAPGPTPAPELTPAAKTPLPSAPPVPAAAPPPAPRKAPPKYRAVVNPALEESSHG